MIAVQKQPNMPVVPSFSIHRRLPSAPSVVVQPTRTPGLLSISKPVQRPQQQQQRSRPSPKPKHAPAKSVQPVLVETAVTPLKPAAEIVEKKQLKQPSSQDKRGRQVSSPKEKITRSSSQSSVRARRHNSRQPSPPNANPSQAEVPSTPRKSNAFQPFVDNSPPSLQFVRQPAPILTARPSGKLARRRRPNVADHSSPSNAIPVPQRNHSASPKLSRSDPFISHLPPPRKLMVAPKPHNPDVFPICDDMTEGGDLSDQEDISIPTTPTPMKTKYYDDGPRTAPLTTSAVAFPFASPASPSSKRPTRRHKRTPSEGVFHMSSDEEHKTSAGSELSSDDLKAFFQMSIRKRATTSISREAELERAAAAAVAAYFASSNFQNSPSPEELPPPAF